MDLSIVIPTLNAASALKACLSALGAERAGDDGDEVIVIDGGSQDDTRQIAIAQGARVVDSDPGRGRQLMSGALAARGRKLIFLHADTVVPVGWRDAVSDLGEEEALAFSLRFDDDSPSARRVAALANWRSRTFGLPYGDQGLVLSRAFYDALGGYRALPLMEDVDLVKRIGKGRLTISPLQVTTSAERYRRGGWWARPVRNLSLLGLYHLGASPERLARLYG